MSKEVEEELVSLVRKVVAEELGVGLEEVPATLGLYGHPKWDSITHVNILVRLEENGSLDLTNEVAQEATTVQRIAEKIKGE